jgi:tape measure domain-containing protein
MAENVNGSLNFRGTLDIVDFEAAISQINSSIRNTANNTASETNRMDNAFKSLGSAIGAYFSFQAIKQLGFEIMRVRGNIQDLNTAFGTMLGSKEKAERLMAQIVKTAATTPFDLQGVASGAKQLLAYGESAEAVNETLVKLGNIASGLSIPLNDIVLLYGTTMVQGRLYAQDVRQFTGRGIPLVRELAEMYGKTTEEINEMVSAGKIGFADVEKVINKMTGAGGQFYNLMAQQSQNLNGQIANLNDALDMMKNNIGTKMQDVFSSGISVASSLVENYEKIGKVLVGLIATYGVYRTSLIVNYFATQSLITTQMQLGIVLARINKAFQALNATMMKNPYILAATAVIGLVSMIWALHDSTTTQENAQKKLNDILDESKQKKQSMIGKTNELIDIIQDETQSIYAQTKAWKDLQKTLPEIFKGLSIDDIKKLSFEDLKKMINSATDGIEFDTANAIFEDAQKRVEYLKYAINQLMTTPSGQFGNGNVYMFQKKLEEAQAEASEAKKKIDEINQIKIEAEFNSKPAEEKLAYYNEELRKLKAEQAELDSVLAKSGDITKQWGVFNWETMINVTKLELVSKKMSEIQGKADAITKTFSVVPVKNKNYWDDQKKAAVDALADMDESKKNTAEWNKQLRLIKEAENHLTTWSTSSKSSTKENPSAGSLDYWNQVRDQATKSLSALSTNDENFANKQIALLKNIAEAEEKISFLEFNNKDFKSKLEERKEQYKQYEKWVKSLGKEVADNKFKELIENGNSYVDYINNQINELNKRKDGIGLSSYEKENLFSLTEQLNEATDAKTDLETFREELVSAKKDAGSLVEYLELLQQKKTELSDDNSDLGIHKKLEIQSETTRTQEELDEELKGKLEKYRTFAQKRIDIEKQYKYDIDRLRESGASEESISIAEQSRTDALSALDDEMAQKEETFKALIQNIGQMSIWQIEKALRDAEDALKESDLNNGDGSMRSGTLRATIKRLQEELKAAKNDKAFDDADDSKRWEKTSKAIRKCKGEIDGIIDSMDFLDETTKEALKAASNIADGTIAMLDSIKTLGVGAAASIAAVEKASVILAIIGVAVQIITAIFNMASKAEKEHQKSLAEVAANKLAMQREYNLLLLEQNLLFEEANTIFGENQIEKAANAVKVYADAMELFKKELKGKMPEMNLFEKTFNDFLGTFQKRLDDFNNGIGALNEIEVKTGHHKTGLFGWGKGKDEYTAISAVYEDLLTSEGKLNIERANAIIETQTMSDENKALLQSLIDLQEAADETEKELRDYLQDTFGDLGSSAMDAIANAIKTDGVDAWEEFGKAGASVLENLGKQLAYELFFSAKFKQLQKDLETIYGSGKNSEAISNDAMNLLGSFYDNIGNDMDDAQKFTEEWQKKAKERGFDLFSEELDSASADPLTGAIKGVSEETASVVAGRLNAVVINQSDSLSVLRQSLIYHAEIAANTRYNKNLEGIYHVLTEMKNSNPLLSQGIS